jgi:hypothetical protein
MKKFLILNPPTKTDSDEKLYSKHGKDVAPYSSYSESEVLFDKGANFHVTSNFFDLHVNKQVIIMMEV